jgi:endonuclease/exonuclease/phosphatase family metal-dependent hydrolase
VVDLGRIVDTAKALGDADVFCFQEVSVNIPALDGGTDQAAALADLLPHHRPIFRPALDSVDENGRARQFGNMILSRLPVLQVFSHLLPWPAEPGVRSMQRQALEVVAQSGFGPVRVVTTHLEYHAAEHRASQLERILEIQAEAAKMAEREPDRSDGPYRTVARPASAILCGDFNFGPSDPLYVRVGSRFLDSWTLRHSDRPHAPTCGIFDHEQWSEGPHCRDFIFVTADLADHVTDVRVDIDASASDHQPVMIELAE